MKQEVESILMSKNINPTSNRMLVLDYLLEQDSAISLSDIEKGMAPVDRITVYRTLKTFEEQGLVHSIDDGSGAPKFALCAAECGVDQHHDLHVHFHCNICNETTCLPNTIFPIIALPQGFKSEEASLMVKGSCSKCIA